MGRIHNTLVTRSFRFTSLCNVTITTTQGTDTTTCICVQVKRYLLVFQAAIMSTWDVVSVFLPLTIAAPIATLQYNCCCRLQKLSTVCAVKRGTE